MYAWYSEKQRQDTGLIEYSTPNGGIVQCTQVTPTLEHGTEWDDMQFIGEVVKYLRRTEEAQRT